MNTNSLKAYNELVKPNLTERESEVLDAIKTSIDGLTIYETAINSNRFPNQISGRFSALERKGMIIKVGIKKINGSSHSIYKSV